MHWRLFFWMTSSAAPIRLLGGGHDERNYIHPRCAAGAGGTVRQKAACASTLPGSEMSDNAAEANPTRVSGANPTRVSGGFFALDAQYLDHYRAMLKDREISVASGRMQYQ